MDRMKVRKLWVTMMIDFDTLYIHMYVCNIFILYIIIYIYQKSKDLTLLPIYSNSTQQRISGRIRQLT